MKHSLIKLMPLAALPLLVACGGTVSIVSENCTAIGAISNMTSTSISYSVAKCNGKIKYRITVTEKNALNINASFTVKEGSIKILVSDANEAALYEGTITEDTNFDVPLKEYGKHFITLEHDQFKGSYKLNWAAN